LVSEGGSGVEGVGQQRVVVVVLPVVPEGRASWSIAATIS
jgi:hypothetical protein